MNDKEQFLEDRKQRVLTTVATMIVSQLEFMVNPILMKKTVLKILQDNFEGYDLSTKSTTSVDIETETPEQAAARKQNSLKWLENLKKGNY